MFEPFRRFPNISCLLIVIIGVILGLIVAVLVALGVVGPFTNALPYAFVFELVALLILAIGSIRTLPNTLSTACCNLLGFSACCCARLLLFFSAFIAIFLLALLAAGAASGFLLVFLAASAVFISFFSLAVFLFCLIRL